MADPRLTLADQALINAMIVVTAPRLGHTENARMVTEMLGELAAKANRDHPKLEPLIEAAEAIWGGERFSAEMRARSALAEIALWRLGQALDAMKKGEAA
jgi:hypothetical protein